MKTLLKYTLLLFVFVYSEIVTAQTMPVSLENALSFEEYLGYVKKYHPLMKQAELALSVGEANLLKARGGFDPKIEVDYDRKKFKNTEYYDQLNATFKIPTWYGVEFKANFEENTGEFLNPDHTVPDGGLYSAGVSFSLAQGFLINERMASLKKARFFREQAKADRDLLVNTLLFEASVAYLEWLKATNEELIYTTFLKNANVRLIAIERSVEIGEKAAIDITEARIASQNRQLNLEAASLKRRKAALIVSNYLWLNDIPMEIREEVVPVLPKLNTLEASLLLEGITDTSRLLRNHPKLLSLDAKINGLTVERSLKLNKLLPKISVQYNFLTSKIDQARTFNTENYKAFVNFSFPLFLRKARGDLRLANLKLQDANLERVSTTITLQNKIDAVYAEINSLTKQNQLVRNIVTDYKALVNAEERKFFLGESSLFIINSREQKLIDVQLKENTLLIKRLMATAGLYNTLGVSI
ncbi:TolC family protein [Aquimarina macrocephali]|uniref:TolC family protein n=1 Tax=Aquimarina macrocephali TaxID=666563 RepID=UPI003F67F2CF